MVGTLSVRNRKDRMVKPFRRRLYITANARPDKTFILRRGKVTKRKLIPESEKPAGSAGEKTEISAAPKLRRDPQNR